MHRSISNLARVGLIAKVKGSKYDGYRFTYGGLDYLALHHYTNKRLVYSVGSRIGVGKESDIMMVADEQGVQKVLKIHRLGRISFRTVKANRDYIKSSSGSSGGWMYLSRLAAMKEFTFMKALRDAGFPVPEPIAQNRHTIVMDFIDAFPLRQISKVPDPAPLYAELITMIVRLAEHGLIHGDFNEFNLLIKEETGGRTENGEEIIKLVPILIDFPQMVSMDHENAEMYFDRDVNCVKRFFAQRFRFAPKEPGPFFKDVKERLGMDGAARLDAISEASGFTKKMLKDLEAAIREKEEKSQGRDRHESDEEEEDSDAGAEGSEGDLDSEEDRPQGLESPGAQEGEPNGQADMSKLSLQ